MTKDSHILIVGAGGNIGSHLVSHIGRMPDVTRVTLVDSDRYEDRNLSSQNVTPRDIGRAKAAVQARRLRQINPALHVVAHRSAAEALPLGALRANVLLACVDSRASRQFLNESARHLGMPWIDAGVDAAGLLVRVNVYPAQQDAPCLECAWSDDDYAALEQRYPCGGNLGVATVATAAPSALGAVAAALQAIECQKLLDGSSILASGQQVLLDLAHHKQYVTSFRRNPACLLASHSAWPISRVPISPCSLTADGVAELAGMETASAFGIAGQQLASRQICTGCGQERRGLRFVSAHPFASERCSRCHAVMLVPGADATDSLSLPLSRHRDRRRSLASLGVRPRDVVIVRGNTGDSYFEIDGDGQ